MTPFHHILANNLVANVTNFTVWFAVTFWMFLETKSVFATGMVAGLYLVATAAFAIWFGSLVDHNRKTRVMLGSSLASLGFYVLALGALAAVPDEQMKRVNDWPLWLFTVLVMAGVMAGQIRGIALPTLVTILVPEDRRDKANGLVGMVQGVGFLTTSVISGLLVAAGGMWAALGFAIGFSVLAFVHLLFVKVDEPKLSAVASGSEPRRVDLRGTIAVVAAVPGLFALIFLASLNNFLGGVFMALLDAYGLSMMSVQAWGFFWAAVSSAFILAGLVISRTGLGPKPLRTLLWANLITWTAGALFAIQPSIVLLGIGTFIWMFLGPFCEAAEHTTLQKVVPLERQGRVFGFAQAVEQSASPLTAFLISPVAQFAVIPFMTNGAGAAAIGDWFGTGPARGMALVFCISGALGFLVTVYAFRSRYYRQLSAAYAAA